MYEYTDKIIRYLLKRFITMFSRAKSLLASFDELNTIHFSRDLYDQLEGITEEKFLMLARKSYKAASEQAVKQGFRRKKRTSHVNHDWLDMVLSQYDPVTLYVYRHEVDRKEARFAEGVIAAKNLNREVDKALRLWSNMIKQYAVTVTDTATLGAYRDYGVEKVMWLTEPDDKRCEECLSRDHVIFSLDTLPPKPHIGCRCWIVPVKEGIEDG